MDTPEVVAEMIKKTIRDEPQLTFEGMNMTFTMKLGNSGGIVDILLETMEKYAKQLEERVIMRIKN